ncbi:KGGVGR-motif variant AAA ATPase [Ideonella sp. A 288]|uniref:KGGVGR-motif variant AAA ATPase n=1 Tax=Ideonella sp. A 288 TaxID=1962181 RepID=UPI000B4BE0EF|nr:SUMF1/EgtB/PvdO family nonheme iron enzyme [Ideonella sp. A 288]
MSERLESDRERAPGIVYTFYSYKGGVGRSMALANVGVILASSGHRVLLIDWDLEAPGLEAYFRHSAKLKGDPTAVHGVIDLLEAHADGRPLDWRECLLKAEFVGHSLDIISAGKRNDDYRHRVQQLNWETLFSEHQIGNYIERLRNDWRAAYDFVLVDSRTGITDIGDICTVLLPDVLVLMFVTNYQNVEGIKGLMARAVRARSKLPIQRSKLLGVPVPARDERDRESQKFQAWQKIFADEFGELYRDWLPKAVEPAEALLRLFIPYIASWSFGEAIPVLEGPRERADPTSLGAAYSRLATLLEHHLDWSALDARVSQSELATTRLEASSQREAAREADLAKKQLEAQLVEAKHAQYEALRHMTARSRRVKFTAATMLAVLVPLLGIAVHGLWWVASNNLPVTYVFMPIKWTLGSLPVPETVELKPNRFTMGCKPGRDVEVGQNCAKAGLPAAREVTLDKPCDIGRFDVTFLEYDHYVWDSGGKIIYPTDQGWGRHQRPVINVSWLDAQAYVAWLSRATGQRYRLPSEAEWEYAARAGKEARYPWGDEPPGQRANCADCEGAPGRTTPVGSYPANAWGLFDMAGNVWQWVDDQADPGGETKGPLRVLRGGSWVSDAGGLRAAIRNVLAPEYQSGGVGFRVCRVSPIDKLSTGALVSEPLKR